MLTLTSVGPELGCNVRVIQHFLNTSVIALLRNKEEKGIAAVCKSEKKCFVLPLLDLLSKLTITTVMLPGCLELKI